MGFGDPIKNMVERSVLHTAASLLGLALVASASLAVVAVAAASSAARPQAPETPVSRTAAEDVGVGSARALQLGINVDPSNPAGNPSPSGIAALGATWVRIEYKDSAPAGSPPSALPTYTSECLCHSLAPALGGCCCHVESG